MDINKNIVHIKTATQIGSGILYPCESNREREYKQLFLVFTNNHLVRDLESTPDIAKTVDIDFFSKDGRRVNTSDFSSIQLYNTKRIKELHNGGVLEDIAVFLLESKYDIDIDLETKVLWDDSILGTIYMEGFPRVLYDNDVTSRMMLSGENKKIFPQNNRIGIFKITDDYHWYSNLKDLKLFQGFSGGPVYTLDDGASYLIGMNQSVLNVSDGENPFKLLYYYKLKYILEYLRNKGCIIYKRNRDSSVSIRWKYE